MSNNRENADSLKPLISRVVEEFAHGISLIEGLEDDAFAAAPGEVGSVGAHFRHNLDFISCLLAGLEQGEIDYSARQRDTRIETDRPYAIGKIRDLADRLHKLDSEDPNREALVRSELDRSVWHSSTFARELEFLHSHTVHHYALIVEKLKRRGIKTDGRFGVAPSTLRFWQERKNRARA